MIKNPFILRLAAFGLLILCVVWFWLQIVLPLLTNITIEQAALSQNLERFARYQTLKKSETELRETMQALSRERLPVYTGASVSAMTATFQRDIGQLASASGVVLGSIRPVNDSTQDEDKFLRLGLQLDLTGVTAQLLQFLKKIKTHQQLVIVDRASIRAIDNGTLTRAANLMIRFDLTTYGVIEK